MTSSIESADVEVRVTVGVDTHADIHVAVALDQLGRRLGAIEIPTTTAGLNQLVDWASAFGVIEQFGIEGTSSYGAGLCRWLRAQGLVVIEADRPDRRTRRFKGKSDPVDAEAAARTVLAGEGRGTPRPRTARSSRSGCCGSPSALHARTGPWPPTRCGPWSPPPPRRYVTSFVT